MAKKGSAKPRARTKKKKAGFSPKLQFMKIMAGLVLLVCLVVTAGLLANRFLMRPSPPVVSKPKPIPITRPETGPVHHSVPDYEAFHREVVPPPPPITRIKPVINGIPVAIIIDDIGYDRKMADGFLALDIPLTFSVLPQGTFNHSIIDKALKKGDVEIMLHLPMEPGNYPSVNPGPGALLSSMNPDELIDQLNANLDRVPNAKGVNNHMGSKLTASSEQMRQIFTILKKRNLFFVDSRTSADTLCRPSAELLHLPFGERDVFIDHIQTPEFVRKQLKLLIKRARRQGYAIGIAHPHPVTLEVLKEMLPELKDAVLFTHASQVVAFQQG
ncbi:MAG: divergent polysaccharide deacetylase family protein [Desulfosarcina sp.]|nr:divergent polysaccharide deacetylase family protein [Desulfosarcina sp.]MBC2766717.1 divergent polysaccharide deacetylase family protein [Desulfosarcina sp.]